MDIRALIGQEGYWVVNKKIVKHTGLEKALLLSIVIDKASYFKNRDMCHEEDGKIWFHWTRYQIEEETLMSYKKHSKILKSLEDDGLISMKLMGSPAKLHYSVIEKSILELIQSSCAKKEQQVVPKGNNKLCPKVTTSCAQREQLYKEEEEQIKNNKEEEGSPPKKEISKTPDEIIDIEKFVKNWNDRCVKVVKIKKMTATREKALNRLLKEHGKVTIALAVKKFFESDFINKPSEKDENSWRADFDFFTKSANFVKVIEGKYDNLQRSVKKSNSIY